MELKDTIDLMNSDNHKDRLKSEYLQLSIRYEKLHKMLIKWEWEKLGFEPNCPFYMLKKQEKVMSEYLSLLEQRMVIENIDF